MNKRELSLEEIQKIELEILKYIHELCEKNNIKYFLDYGTLLGAVRHKGFIPWDDDTDISLAREEFEKLYDVLKKENHEHFKLISNEIDSRYPFNYYRVYDNRTYRDSNLKNKEIQLGTCVDVFPYDGYITDREDEKKIKFYYKMKKLSSYSFNGIKNEGKSFFNNFIRCILTFIVGFTDTQKWNKKIVQICKKYKNTIGGFSALTIMPNYNRKVIKTEWLYDTIDMEYEGILLKVPRNYKEFLVYEFGENYMIPISPSEITNGKDKNYIVE